MFKTRSVCDLRFWQWCRVGVFAYKNLSCDPSVNTKFIYVSNAPFTHSLKVLYPNIVSNIFSNSAHEAVSRCGIFPCNIMLVLKMFQIWSTLDFRFLNYRSSIYFNCQQRPLGGIRPGLCQNRCRK